MTDLHQAIAIATVLLIASAIVGIALLRSPAVPTFKRENERLNEQPDNTNPKTRAFIAGLWKVR